MKPVNLILTKTSGCNLRILLKKEIIRFELGKMFRLTEARKNVRLDPNLTILQVQINWPPISIRGGRLCPPHYNSPPSIFRPSYSPAYIINTFLRTDITAVFSLGWVVRYLSILIALLCPSDAQGGLSWIWDIFLAYWATFSIELMWQAFSGKVHIFWEGKEIMTKSPNFDATIINFK